MPELSRFYGIVIRMFVEIGGPHHVPHFHAYYQDDVGIFGIDSDRVDRGFNAAPPTAVDRNMGGTASGGIT